MIQQDQAYRDQIEMDAQEKTNGMLCHLLSFLSLAGIPMGNIIGPLIFWSTKKEESNFVDECGKESINFQITMTIYFCISFILCFVMIGFLFLLILSLMELICVLKACIAANNGMSYKYPMTISFIK